MNGGIFALRRLRWKLALLVAELILVAALVAFAISPVLPSLAPLMTAALRGAEAHLAQAAVYAWRQDVVRRD